MDPAIAPGQIPGLSTQQATLVGAIDDGATYEELWDLVCANAEGFTDVGALRLRNVRAAFAEDQDKRATLKTLFFSIPRRLLRSVVLNTVALDLHDRQSPNWDHAYEPRSAGTYAVGLTVKGRRGRFLTPGELRTVLNKLEKYEQAVRFLQSHVVLEDAFGNSQIPPDVLDAIETAREVDERFLTDLGKRWTQGEPLSMPRYASSSSKKPEAHIASLRAMLRRRLLSSSDAHADERLIASPVYVGCGKAMETRVIEHDPRSTGGGGSSKILRLTQACMACCGFSPDTVPVGVVRAWEPGHVALSEMLVTVLADSLVSRAGFNVVTPGTNSPELASDWSKELLQASRELVWAERPFLSENLRLARAPATSARAEQWRQAMADIDAEPTLATLRRRKARLVGPEHVDEFCDSAQEDVAVTNGFAGEFKQALDGTDLFDDLW
ncbi:uncharacterized protein PG998_002916 [Apiospora kogelbergensis]|uniref:uncharacterized protein n=1 Tax=Apiospora kogelbergensis TaxID=1337665 RepID=UPI00312EBA64